LGRRTRRLTKGLFFWAFRGNSRSRSRRSFSRSRRSFSRSRRWFSGAAVQQESWQFQQESCAVAAGVVAVAAASWLGSGTRRLTKSTASALEQNPVQTLKVHLELKTRTWSRNRLHRIDALISHQCLLVNCRKFDALKTGLGSAFDRRGPDPT
jgi:hypothetical protein